MIQIDMEMPDRCFVCKLKLHGTCSYLVKSTGGVNSKVRLDNCPLREIPSGKWIDDGPINWKCSECGYVVPRWNNTRYCPNCGVFCGGKLERPTFDEEISSSPAIINSESCLSLSDCSFWAVDSWMVSSFGA